MKWVRRRPFTDRGWAFWFDDPYRNKELPVGAHSLNVGGSPAQGRRVDELHFE